MEELPEILGIIARCFFIILGIDVVIILLLFLFGGRKDG